jgi:hypothetical protein
LSVDAARFNNAVRSELLVAAYKNIGPYDSWGEETLALLAHAPMRQVSYSERSEYLAAAYYSQIITWDEYNEQFQELLNQAQRINESFIPFTRYLVERDRNIRVGEAVTMQH